jgi:hypothetical protein
MFGGSAKPAAGAAVAGRSSRTAARCASTWVTGKGGGSDVRPWRGRVVDRRVGGVPGGREPMRAPKPSVVFGRVA